MIAETLQRGNFSDEILLDYAHHITVSEVRTSPDLKQATAYVVTLNGADTDGLNIDDMLPALNNAAHYFQREIGKNHNLKFTPKVRFVKDKSFDEAKKIDDILENITYSTEDRESNV